MDSFASLFCDKLEGQETFEDFLSTETEDFVPDSLAAFIDEAKATLRATQMSLRGHLDSPSRSSTICDDDDSTTPKYNNMLEDDDDRLLRDEVMGKFKGAQMFSPKSDVMISPTKMNISGISITSPSKSTPHMDDQSEELFTISAFAQLQGNELLLADEEFASATKHHEEPELVLDTWVRSTQGEKSIETTSMVRMPQEVQTSEVVTSPSSSKQEELESRLDTKREGSVETPFGSGSHQLVQAADPAPQAPAAARYHAQSLAPMAQSRSGKAFLGLKAIIGIYRHHATRFPAFHRTIPGQRTSERPAHLPMCPRCLSGRPEW